MSKIHETLQKYILADGLRPVFDVEKSHGSYLFDASSGKEFLDLFSFFATQPVAFNHPMLRSGDFTEKIAKHAIHRPSLSDIYTEEYAEFVDTFVRHTNSNEHFSHYFFIEGGTLGVENALKVAMDWKTRKNLSRGIEGKGNQIIHFRNAFHGRSGYTLSMTNTFDPRKYQYFARHPWPRIEEPALSFPCDDKVIRSVEEKEHKALEQIKKSLQDHQDDIAALIIEPIQGEGGDQHFRNEFFLQLRQLADQHEFLLIFDEVQTGIGLTGKMWCFEHFDIKPDLIAYGKKVQVAGCAASTRVDEVPDNVFHTSSRINSTWGGNLVDMIRCQRYLEIIEKEKLIENAATMGNYFVEQLQQWAKEKNQIHNVRGRGLMIAFDFETSEKRNIAMKTLWDKGIIILACGPKSLRIRPHLDLSKQDIDHAMNIISDHVKG
ncbi:MAG: L-lysine 6-transaminase [Bdellovibrionales bacterium]|nr:L-lysine 6-transaminase [Bdellovibrionales bacterium]